WPSMGSTRRYSRGYRRISRASALNRARPAPEQRREGATATGAKERPSTMLIARCAVHLRRAEPFEECSPPEPHEIRPKGLRSSFPLKRWTKATSESPTDPRSRHAVPTASSRHSSLSDRKRSGRPEVEALAKRHAQRPEDGELLFGLDPLGNDLG